MRIHALQHVEFEDPAFILQWAEKKGHLVTRSLLYHNNVLPPADSFDLLVIMGGPMNIYEHDKFPWLVSEKKFIREAIDCGRSVLGICLGAQLIADVLGGKVTRNPEKEIGWFPVTVTAQAARTALMKDFPRELTPFHWHGDTFSIPPGAISVAHSSGCKQQAFEFEGRVLALQFHLEATRESIQKLIDHCAQDMTPPGPYVQSPAAVLSRLQEITRNQALMADILERFEAAVLPACS